MAQIIHNVSFPNDNLGDPLRVAFVHQNEMNTELYETKVDKITGQGLSENNYTTIEKTKLAGIEDGAQVNVPINYDDIIDAPEVNNIAAYPDTRYPYVDSLSFIIPENVQPLSVRKVGSPTETSEDWTVLGNVVTYLGTMVEGDYLIISGVYVVGSSNVGGDYLLLSGGTVTGNIKSPQASDSEDLVTLGQVEQLISEEECLNAECVENMPTFDNDNEAASLPNYTPYKTSTGQLRYKLPTTDPTGFWNDEEIWVDTETWID